MNISSGNVNGTVGYIPPERAAYDPDEHYKEFYELGDIYSLGLFIWELLYYVHHGTSLTCVEAILPGCLDAQDILIAITSGRFIPPCDFLPVEVRNFLSNCWETDLELRYQNTRIVAEEWGKLTEAFKCEGEASSCPKEHIEIKLTVESDSPVENSP